MLVKKDSRKYICSVLKSIKKTVISLCFLVSGYMIGNYNLLIDPKATLSGIRAYPASFSFQDFLVSKSRIVWDHINDLPFNFSVMSLFTITVLLFIMPIAFKKWRYLFVSIFMAVCLYFYIQYFSPGYAWHGFTIGLFIVTFIAFFLSDIQTDKKSVWKNRMMKIAVGIQIFNCFVYYVPLQTKWFLTTEKAIDIMEEKEPEIYADVVSLLAQINDSYYIIDEAVKRYKPVAVSATAWNKINLENTYYAATNYGFVDPLESTNYFDWIQLRQNERYSNDASVYQYIIWIVPDCFKSMGDIANIHLYDDYSIINRIHGEGYTVYLYSVC